MRSRLPRRSLLSLFVLGCHAAMIAQDDKAQLMITTRPEILNGVQAGVHAFSQVEILNVHPSEPVFINSVEVAIEQTVVEGYLIMESIPQQIHASRVDALRLDPGAVAVVPLTFLPRYPRDYLDLPEPSLSASASLSATQNQQPLPMYPSTTLMKANKERDYAPPLSSYQRTDLAHLVGEETVFAADAQSFYSLDGDGRNRPNNLDYNNKRDRKHPKLYEVHTSILIGSSRGRSIVSLTASSVRVNHYRVPERIRFRPPSFSSKWDVISRAHHLQTVDRSGVHEVMGMVYNNCYDLYIYNPRPTDLDIMELSLHKPESVALFKVEPGQDMINATAFIQDFSTPRQIVKHGETQYVVTICAMDAKSASDILLKPQQAGDDWQVDYAKVNYELGYLQVKTAESQLFIFLEYNLTAEYLRGLADKLSERGKERQSLDFGPANSHLRAWPVALSAAIIPYSYARETLKVSIENIASVAIKVMRISLLLEDDKAKVIQDTGMKFQLSSRLDPTCGATILMDLGHSDDYKQNSDCGVIYEHDTWTDSVTLDVWIDSNATMHYLQMDGGLTEVSGSIVITATTDIALSYQDWYNVMRRNPYNLEKVVLEIPWTVRLIDGRMHAVMADTTAPNVHLRHDINPIAAGRETVDAFFFPFEPLDSRDWDVWPGLKGRMYDYVAQGISHTVRIVAHCQSPLQITKVRIERDESDPRSRVCDRFIVNVSDPVPSSIGELKDVGLIRVGYTYDLYRDQFRRREGKGELQNIIDPTVCRLTFETHPIRTGEHVIDLVVFTGKLEVSTGDPEVHVRSNGVSEFPFTPRGREHIVAASLAVGFDRGLTWFESSIMGSTLLKHLRRKSMFGRWTSAASLFREYILNLANFTQDGVDSREGFVDPIIMHAGPIAHGETVIMPLHFTNHNPVPIQVFMDVGEVEGMSISISRETSRIRGDGNSMLDFLPHDIRKGFDRIVGGAWGTHSREGLKKFLMFSDVAQSFFNFLPHRDAIEVSPRATSRLPILRSLYKKRAKATFHADMYSLNFYSDKMNGCDGDEKNPSGYLNVEERVQGWPGPLLLSDDAIVAHSNSICDPDFLPDVSNYPRSTNMMYLKHTPVTIPPGGVARFDVKVRAPERDSLNKDVTAFLSTGLVISTDHGQISPIIVTFEALLGQLKLSNSLDWAGYVRSWQKQDSFSHQYHGEIVEVPLRLFQAPESDGLGRNRTAITIPPSLETPSSSNLTTWIPPLGASEVPIYLSSSFSRDVVLRDIESCNPWFHINVKRSNSTIRTGSSGSSDTGAVEIGTLRTAINCPTMQDLLDIFHEIEIPENYPLYPSFYQCALEWLENRTLLQGYGCGTRPMPTTDQTSDYGAEDDATERALDALHHAITFSMFKYANGRLKYDTEDNRDNSNSSWGELQAKGNCTDSKAGSGRGSAFVDRLTLDIYAEVTDAWRVLSELDLHSITSSFRATLEYSYPDNAENQQPDEDEPQSLTVSMRDVAIRAKLEMPKLVKSSNNYMYRGFDDHDDEFFSVLEFPPTEVVDVTSLMLQLRNPTGIPVKVKLSTISLEELTRESNKAEEFNTLTADQVRELYLDRFESIYTQTGFDSSVKNPGQFWWEGRGAFYQSDDQGHLVQSLHNVSLQIDNKARTSMINPSLFARSAFAVGCATRCGLRDDKYGANSFETRLRTNSPIGASAAAGAVLVGKAREAAEKNDLGDDEPTLSAGGTAYADSAPAAFGIPYSAFDEIILPPYGEAEVGPILFRPPGRYGLMGCDAVLDTDAIPFGEKIAESCSSAVFQSMVLLENSLTGLERVVVRGKGMWESVVFLDPMGNDSVDAVGDLELRNGQTTLMFPGSAVSGPNAGSKPRAVTKAVVVQNDGDVDVEFSRVFLTENNVRKIQGNEASVSRGCSYRGFRLLGCHERGGATFGNWDAKKDKETVYVDRESRSDGFRLPAGANRTIFVEHSPDCTFQSDYVALRFEFKRDTVRGRHRRGDPLSFLASDGNRVRSRWSESRRRMNLVLLVGFHMSDDDLRTCIPVKPSQAEPPFVKAARDVFMRNEHSSPLSPSEVISGQQVSELGGFVHPLVHGVVERRNFPSDFLDANASIASALLVITLVTTLLCLRSTSSKSFREKIRGIRGLRGRSESFDGNIAQSSWSSTFRCLARADPTSSELQTISREQVKQIVLHRYKTIGIMMPQCIDLTGSFYRDGGGQRVRNCKGNAAMKTLSEAVFHKCSLVSDPQGETLAMPCGLGWRSSIARRIIQNSLHSSLKLRSEIVMAKQRDVLRDDSGSIESFSGGDIPGQQSPMHPQGVSDWMDAAVGHLEILPQVDTLTTKSIIQQADPFPEKDESNSPSSDDLRRLDKNPLESIDVVEERKVDVRFSVDVRPISVVEKKGTGKGGAGNRSTNSLDTSDQNNGIGSSLVEKSSPRPENNVSAKLPERFKKEAGVSKRSKASGRGKRTLGAQLVEGPPSSPASFKSVSSRSSVSPDVTPIESKRIHVMRPPPGLAPPPGFSGFDSASALDMSLSNVFGQTSQSELTFTRLSHSAQLPSLDTSMSQLQAMRSDSSAALDQLYSASSPADVAMNSSSLFDRIRATDEKNLEISPSSLNRVSTSSRDASTGVTLLSTIYPSRDDKCPVNETRDSLYHQDSGGGFDVMGFLDNLLDESGRDDDSEGVEIVSSNDIQITPVLEDPWAFERQSGAVGHGIFGEGKSGDMKVDDSGIIQAILAASPKQDDELDASTLVIPLLGPALNPNAISVFEDDDHRASPPQDYNSGDFYARLLGE